MDDHLAKIYELVTQDETLNKRFLEICLDPRLDEHARIHYLGELLNTCIEVIDKAELIRLGQKNRT